MLSTEKILSEMEKILDSLIENASQLLQLSKQVIVEEELDLLQKKQEELMTLLVNKDEAFHKACGNKEYQSPLREVIDAKLEHFRKLNAQFIDNIMRTHGLIQLDKGKAKKRSK